MNTGKSENWEKIGKGAAAEIKIAPKQLEYIEARGFLCHELLYMLGGHIEFIETPWSQLVLKILEFILPISPICRWFPSEDCILEWVGFHSQSETRVYRLTPMEGSIVVFFVEHKPEPPAGGGYIRPLFNVPQLEISKFLRPPFDESNNNLKIEQILRIGLVQKFSPIPMTSKARNRVMEIHMETCKGLWEEFAVKN
jgi:hypothetical protein